MQQFHKHSLCVICVILILCFSINKINSFRDNSGFSTLFYCILLWADSPLLHPCQCAPSQGAALKTGSHPPSAPLQHTESTCSKLPEEREREGKITVIEDIWCKMRSQCYHVVTCLADAVGGGSKVGIWLFYGFQWPQKWGDVDNSCFVAGHPWHPTGFHCCTKVRQELLKMTTGRKRERCAMMRVVSKRTHKL